MVSIIMRKMADRLISGATKIQQDPLKSFERNTKTDNWAALDSQSLKRDPQESGQSYQVCMKALVFFPFFLLWSIQVTFAVYGLHI